MRSVEFCTLLEKHKPGPIYFLCGPDRFLHEECRAAVINALPAQTREWCFAEIAFEPSQLRRTLDDANQMPMLGEHAFVFITDSDDFDRATDEDAEALERFLKKPPPFTTVLFAAFEPDRRRRFIKLLEKKAELVDLLPVSLREATVWLKNFLHRNGFEIRPELAQALAARFEGQGESSSRGKPPGVNLLWMRTETEKLLLAHPGTRRLEEADLDLIVASREEHEIGKLLAAVAERRLSDALALLRALLRGKESETLILWCIADLFRQALKSAGSPGHAHGGWGRPANPYSTFEIAPRAARGYTREEMIGALRLSRATDLAVKSSWKDAGVLLECLLWQIVAGHAPQDSARWLAQASAAPFDSAG